MVQLNLRPGPDYMSRAALVCRDDFQPVQDGWCDEPREIGASLILARRRNEPLDILWPEVVVFKSDTTRMRTLRYSILALNTSCFHHLHFAIPIVHLKFCGCHVCRRLKPLCCTVAYNYLATRVTKTCSAGQSKFNVLTMKLQSLPADLGTCGRHSTNTWREAWAYLQGR